MNIPPDLPVTQAQLDYADGLRKRLNLPKRMLDGHCQSRFKRPLAALDRAQMSALIDEMKGWAAIPSDLQREAGQLDLRGFGR